jgi:histone acetyltransferase (RNA polymerase elongator complex component)
VGNVVAEIREVLNRHPFYGSVLLEDDSFLFRKTEEIREFAALYAENVHLPFGIEMNPSEVSEEKLRLLQESGLSLVHVGIQSGDAEIRRKYYNRNTSDKAICQTNKILSKLGILHKYDIIVDTPFVGDTQASLRMLRKFKPYFSVNLYSLRVYPGLALEQVMRKAGFDGWLKANDNKVSYNEILSEDPYSFVLKLYRTFPPTRWSRFLARICGSPLLFHLLRRLLASWTCRQLLTRMFGMKPR